MTDLERARRVFGKTPFTSLVGCEIDAVGEGYARCSLALAPEHMNALGKPMGGVVFTLADYAFGVASNFDRDVYVSASADIHFTAPARGERLIAEAREIRSDDRTCLFDVRVTDELGTLAALVTIAGVVAGTREKSKKKPAASE